MNSSEAPHRRQFVRAALATAASYGRILGANDRVRVGAIGTGGRGQYLWSQLKLAGQNEIVACCDVYEPRRLEAKSKYATEDALLCLDYREILDRRDIDAVRAAQASVFQGLGDASFPSLKETRNLILPSMRAQARSTFGSSGLGGWSARAESLA